MISEKDLTDAIAECLGQRNPNAQTCIKLAAFYTIHQNLYGKQDEIILPEQSYSGSTGTVTYDSGTEFSDLIQGKDIEEVLPLMDELMTTVQVLHPRLYNSVIRKLRE